MYIESTSYLWADKKDSFNFMDFLLLLLPGFLSCVAQLLADTL